MSTQPNRPNYFELLGIDPDKSWNEPEFQKILLVKKAEWTKLTRNPKNAKLYSSYLEMVPKIQALMKDEVLRNQEIEAAKRLKHEKTSKAQENFKADLDLRASKGFLLETEINTLIEAYKGKVNETDIRSHIKQKNIDIRQQNSTGGHPNLETVDSSIFKSIQANLEVVKKVNLYDFLEYPHTTAASVLLGKAKSIFAENQKQGERTAQLTASSELAGQASTIFKDEIERKKYDNSLAEAVYHEIGDEVARLLQGTDKVLYAGQFRMLLEKARSKGLDIDKCSNHIRERAKMMGAAIEIIDSEFIKKQQRCPNCESLNDSQNKNCSKCGFLLMLACPSCNQSMYTENTACTNCGFPIGNMPLVHQLIADSSYLLQTHQYNLALQKAQFAQQLWSTLTSKSLSDNLTKEISKALKAAQDHQQDQDNHLAQLNKAIEANRFYEARDLFSQLEETVSINLTNEKQQIKQAIDTAEQRLKQITGSTTSDQIVEICLKILQDCSDCAQARKALAKTPPNPPSVLQAHVGGKVISLRWQVSSSKSVRYVVVCKRESSPISAKDGKHLATIDATHYDDTNPEIGVPLYYAVYADREGVLSNDAALIETPVLLIQGVSTSTLTANIDDQQIQLNWEAPPNTSKVIVVRSDTHSPHDSTDGEQISVLDKSHALDTGLINGKTYYYGIFCAFTNHLGKTIISSGAFVSATPETPPNIIEDLEIEVVGVSPKHTLRLSWDAPNKGKVIVLQSPQPPHLIMGTIIPESDLGAYGKSLPSKLNAVEINVERTKINYFTPVVLFQKMAYIGKTTDYANVEDVSDLTVRNQNVELQLRWQWPSNCTKVIVTYSHTDYPNAYRDNLEDVTRMQITRAQYELHGYFAIKNPPKRDYYIVVFAIMTQDGQELTASGHSAGARFNLNILSVITINYEIVCQHKLFREPQYILKLEVNGTGELPTLILVRKQGGLPLNKNDGELIHRIKPKELLHGKSQLEELLDNNSKRHQNFARLFLEDDTFYDSRGGHIRILYPAQEKLRLF